MLVELLGQLAVEPLVAWAEAIPAEAWPREAGSMHGIEWRDAATAVAPYIPELLAHFSPEAAIKLHYFSMIWPGCSIGTHTDYDPVGRLARVHVPILTNPQAFMCYADEMYHMAVGQTYTVTPTAPHSVYNKGKTPRLHWIFDVFEP